MFLSQFSHDSPLSQMLHRRLNAKKDINYDDNDINYVSEEAVNESCFLLGLANSMSERYVEICILLLLPLLIIMMTKMIMMMEFTGNIIAKHSGFFLTF